METIKAILTRRSIRDFKKKSVSKKLVDQILESALAAPSAKNSNPWYFLVLRGKDKNEVAKWMREAVGRVPTSPIDPVTKKANPKWGDSTSGSAEIIEKASVLILIFNRSPFIKGRKTLARHVSEGSIFTYSDEIVGIGASLQNILLAAHTLGLGAVCLADVFPTEKKLQKKYNTRYELIVGVPIGYPTYNPPRRKLSEGLVQFGKN